MFITRLPNFGNTIYEGTDMSEAFGRAVDSGFEATVEYVETGRIVSYSPISGWKVVSKGASK